MKIIELIDSKKTSLEKLNITEEECIVIKNKIIDLLNKLPTSAAKGILKNILDKDIDFVSIVSPELFSKR